jgi:hypothetical protein
MLAWITLICGVIWIIYSFIQKTKNLASTMVYNIIPFFTGAASIFVSLVLFGIFRM